METDPVHSITDIANDITIIESLTIHYFFSLIAKAEFTFLSILIHKKQDMEERNGYK